MNEDEPAVLRPPSVKEVDGIAVLCDSEKHRNAVLVNKFAKTRDGRWVEWAGRSGHSLIADPVDEVETVRDEIVGPVNVTVPNVDAAEDAPWPLTEIQLGQHLKGRVRHRYALQCKRCRQSVVVREERLRSALDKVAALGVSEISLSALAAIVGRTGTAGP
ncbi:hypothetical protein [Gordonia paraffinivorans]|uniref:hypothetical protein n=1 Tax=Gordonia paraffinivorans TaxID=175628 RepID=UPI0011B25DFF|nr:hypothetical protein [Gordonia paraffinivorans]